MSGAAAEEESAVLDVCAAVIQKQDRFLLTTRPAGTHLAGKWEFPGGKLHRDESVTAAVQREMEEELGVKVTPKLLLTVVPHAYPEKKIRLQFIACELADDQELHAHDGQKIGWFTLAELRCLDLAPADRSFLNYLMAMYRNGRERVLRPRR